MPNALDRAVKQVRELPLDKQEFAAELFEDFARNQADGCYGHSDEEERLIDEGIAELDRGEGVSHDEMKVLLAKYRI